MAAKKQSPSRSVRDYAGIAALLTAVGGILGTLWNQSRATDRNDALTESAMVLLQYRIQQVEVNLSSLAVECRKADRVHLISGLKRPRSDATAGTSDLPQIFPNDLKPAVVSPSSRKTIKHHVTKAILAKLPVSLEDLESYIIQEQRPLNVGDLQ